LEQLEASSKEASSSPSSSLSLLQSGLFSDNHVLANIYLGELCFWHLKYSHEWMKFLYTEWDLKELAIKHLTVYVNAVQNVLKDHGWNCDRALELIVCLKEENW
jgi:hypothetical protein